MSYVNEVLERVKKQNPDQPEFIQAVTEVLESLAVVIEKNEDAYRKNALWIARGFKRVHRVGYG